MIKSFQSFFSRLFILKENPDLIGGSWMFLSNSEAVSIIRYVRRGRPSLILRRIPFTSVLKLCAVDFIWYEMIHSFLDTYEIFTFFVLNVSLHILYDFSHILASLSRMGSLTEIFKDENIFRHISAYYFCFTIFVDIVIFLFWRCFFLL